VTARRVLVTGAAGRLGLHAVRCLAGAGWEVSALLAPADDFTRIEQYVGVHAFRGDALDARDVENALEDAEVVVHLAAIPAPALAPGERVFLNSVATYVVLDAATRVGVERAVIAGSIAATGLSFSPNDARPAYLPFDEEMPAQEADPYALSKTTDESICRMMNRRSGLTTTVVRMPFLGTPADRLPAYGDELAAEPWKGIRDAWAYLDTRDAGRALALAAERRGGDAQVMYAVAPETLVPYRTQQLVERFLPDVPRRRSFDGREVPIDLTRAPDLIGFTAEYLWPVEPRDLPVGPRANERS
jgi:nucleoside-diphosphate-sugar epimerase